MHVNELTQTFLIEILDPTQFMDNHRQIPQELTYQLAIFHMVTLM